MINDPPLGICPLHTDKQAWRVCLRCGRFLCALCANPTPKGSLCPECLATIPPAVPRISGWLVLPLLSLVINPIILVKTFSDNRDVSFDDATAGWIAYWVWCVLPSVVSAVVSAITLPLFLMRKRIVPKLMIGLYAFALATNLLDFMVSKLVPEEWVAQPGSLMFAVGPLTWLLYFQFSERVQRTFVR